MNYAEAMIYLWNAMENIAIAASCTIAAIHFEKPGMLRTSALLAGGLGLEGHAAHALVHNALTRAAAVGTGLGTRACLGTRAVTGRALVETVVADLLLTSEGRLLKGQSHPRAHVVAPLRAVSALGGAAAEGTAEDTAENIAQITEVTEAAAKAASAVSASVSTARGGIKGCVAVLVVLCLFICVRQDGVGLVDLLEVLFRLGISGVQVGMVFLRQLTVRPLDGVRVGGFIEAQYLVVVSLCQGYMFLSVNAE